MVAANNGLIGMSKEHLGIALALNVPGTPNCFFQLGTF